MKKLLLFGFLAIGFFASAQNVEPEVVYSGEGKIIMIDGKELSGEISYSFVTSRKILYTAPGAEREKISANDVKEFTISGTRFVRVVVPALSIGKDWEFAICLTPENYKISVFETINQGIVGNGNGYNTERDYCIKFPGDEKAKSLSDLSFMPFNKKVSKLVSDCPALAEKITNKVDGYKIGMITTPEQRFDVFMKVASEYQECN